MADTETTNINHKEIEVVNWQAKLEDAKTKGIEAVSDLLCEMSDNIDTIDENDYNDFKSVFNNGDGFIKREAEKATIRAKAQLAKENAEAVANANATEFLKDIAKAKANVTIKQEESATERYAGHFSAWLRGGEMGVLSSYGIDAHNEFMNINANKHIERSAPITGGSTTDGSGGVLLPGTVGQVTNLLGANQSFFNLTRQDTTNTLDTISYPFWGGTATLRAVNARSAPTAAVTDDTNIRVDAIDIAVSRIRTDPDVMTVAMANTTTAVANVTTRILDSINVGFSDLIMNGNGTGANPQGLVNGLNTTQAASRRKTTASNSAITAREITSLIDVERQYGTGDQLRFFASRSIINFIRTLALNDNTGTIFADPMTGEMRIHGFAVEEVADMAGFGSNNIAMIFGNAFWYLTLFANIEGITVQRYQKGDDVANGQFRLVGIIYANGAPLTMNAFTALKLKA